MVVTTAFRHSSVQYHTGNYLLPKICLVWLQRILVPAITRNNVSLYYWERPFGGWCIPTDLIVLILTFRLWIPNSVQTITAENLHPPLSVSDSSHVVRM